MMNAFVGGMMVALPSSSIMIDVPASCEQLDSAVAMAMATIAMAAVMSDCFMVFTFGSVAF